MKFLNNCIFTYNKGNYIKLGKIIWLKMHNNQKIQIVYFNKNTFNKYYKLSGIISNEIKTVYNNL